MKRDCHKRHSDNQDKVNATIDIAFSVSCHAADDAGTSPVADRVMLSVGVHPMDAFMIDGGSTCHILGFKDVTIDSSLFNKRPADITIVVGGGTRLRCLQNR